MDTAAIRRARWRAHRLSAPAGTVAEAAQHMLATQAQEFWGGRWALAVRTRNEPSVRDVDAAFDGGQIVRSWTMRGTIHAIPARDLGWVLSVTAARQEAQGATTRRREGLDQDQLARAQRAVTAALSGGNRLTRRELFEVLDAGGVDTAGQRGYHAAVALSLRGILCQGPVVPRTGGPTREQYFVLASEWISDPAAPEDPLAELFTRFIRAHGPAGVRDFAWWAGLPLGVSRSAAHAASDRVRVLHGHGEPLYQTADAAPRRSGAAPEVVALPPFDEYYLSYADRTVACAPELLARVGPGKNGMVRPILVARGEVVGVWTHSVAVGRHAHSPVPELFLPGAASESEVAAALERYRAFITA